MDAVDDVTSSNSIPVSIDGTGSAMRMPRFSNLNVYHRRRKRGGGGRRGQAPSITLQTIPFNSFLEFSILSDFKMRNIIY